MSDLGKGRWPRWCVFPCLAAIAELLAPTTNETRAEGSKPHESVPVPAPQELIPEAGSLFEWGPDFRYYAVLRRFLLDGDPRHRRCQALFESDVKDQDEQAVFIEGYPDSPAVVLRRPKQSLREVLARARGTADKTRTEDWRSFIKLAPQDIVEEFRSGISRADAGLFEQVWRAMLARTTYPPGLSDVFDKRVFHFAQHDPEGGLRAGMVWVPSGKVGELVHLGRLLGEYARTEAGKKAEKLRTMRAVAERVLRSLGQRGS
jgi:hypothetical protein